MSTTALALTFEELTDAATDWLADIDAAVDWLVDADWLNEIEFSTESLAEA